MTQNQSSNLTLGMLQELRRPVDRLPPRAPVLIATEEQIAQYRAIKWDIPSKHLSILTNACEITVAADLGKKMEQAWASIEGMLLDAVIERLCAPAGKIDNVIEYLNDVSKTRYFQDAVNKPYQPMHPAMRKHEAPHMQDKK